MENPDYWFENQHLLQQGQVFSLQDGSIVRLDRRVPGDGTNWNVDDQIDNTWRCEDREIHPGELGEQLS